MFAEGNFEVRFQPLNLRVPLGAGGKGVGAHMLPHFHFCPVHPLILSPRDRRQIVGSGHGFPSGFSDAASAFLQCSRNLLCVLVGPLYQACSISGVGSSGTSTNRSRWAMATSISCRTSNHLCQSGDVGMAATHNSTAALRARSSKAQTSGTFCTSGGEVMVSAP